jgi:hypothetical protein
MHTILWFAAGFPGSGNDYISGLPTPHDTLGFAGGRHGSSLGIEENRVGADGENACR